MSTSNRTHEVRITLLENGHAEIIKKLDGQDVKMDQMLTTLNKMDVLGEIIKNINLRMDKTDDEIKRIDKAHDGIYERLRKVDGLDSDVKQVDRDITAIQRCIDGEDGVKHDIAELSRSVQKLQTLVGGISIAVGVIIGIFELLKQIGIL